RTDASAAKTDVINIRNIINRVLREQKAKNVIVIAVAYNEKGTIVCITCEDCTAAEVLKHKDAIYKELSKVDKAVRTSQVYVEWSKVIIHNVSCKRYEDDETLMNALAHEIQNMNSQDELVTAPRWLTYKNV